MLRHPTIVPLLAFLVLAISPRHLAVASEAFNPQAVPGETAPANLPPFSRTANQWLHVLDAFNNSAITIYDQVAREHIALYAQRAATNAAISRSLSLSDRRIPALAQQLWDQECAVWQSVRIHLSGVEDRVYPTLTLYTRSIEELLSAEVRRDPRYQATIAEINQVVPVARRKYAEDCWFQRNRGLRATRRLINAMLQLHRMALRQQELATNGKEAADQLRRLQTAYEKIYERASSEMEQAVTRYWIDLRKIIGADVIAVNLKCSLTLLATVK